MDLNPGGEMGSMARLVWHHQWFTISMLQESAGTNWDANSWEAGLPYNTTPLVNPKQWNQQLQMSATANIKPVPLL